MVRINPWMSAALFYTAAAAALLWPLVAAIGDVVPQPSDDPLLTVWTVWWNSHATLFSNDWWNAPIFYPTAGTLAFSELLAGLTPITAPIQWITRNPVAAHNVALLLSFPLSAIAAHALAFEVTGRHDAALVAGTAFGFAAFRANDIVHIQMLSVYWAPVAVLAMHRYVRQPRAGWLALFGGACIMQVLCNGYTLFQLPVLIGLWLLWFARRRRDMIAIAAAFAGAIAALAPILLKYREIHQSLQLRRSIDEIVRFSASIESFFSAPASNLMFGELLTARQSYGLFPGLTVVLCLAVAVVLHLRHRPPMPMAITRDRAILAAVAVAAAGAAASVWLAGPWKLGPLSASTPHKPLTLAILAATIFLLRGPRWGAVWRARTAVGFYSSAAVVFVVLSLGPEPHLLGVPIFYKAPYAWLMHLPGYDSIRAPDRFAMIAVLCVAILIAATFARWSAPTPRRATRWSALLCAGLLLDGWFRVHVGAVPPRPALIDWRDAVAVVELPLETRTHSSATFRSIWYGRPVLNGVSGYVPPHFPALEAALADGDASVLFEFAGRGPIGVAIDRASSAQARWVAALSSLPGVIRLDETPAWTNYLLPAASPPVASSGTAIGISRVDTNAHPEEAHHLIDGRFDRAWATTAQEGHEEIVVTLDDSYDVGSVVMRLGVCPYGFPRWLVVDAATDDGWRQVFSGPTAVLTVRAALAEPAAVPLTIPVGMRTRSLRLRQTRADAAPLCIAELSVHAR